MKKLFFSFIAMLIICSSLVEAAAPLKITLQATLSSQSTGLLHNQTRNVRVAIFSQGNTMPVWNESITGVSFINGTCSIILGNNEPLLPEHFDISNPIIRLTLLAELGNNGLPESDVEFSVPSTPYAVLAKLAETVKSLDASKITGSFTSTLNIESDFNVGNGVLFVDNGTRRVGIGTQTPAYDLDVDGVINADGFRIQGQDIESVLSWQKNNSNLFYNTGRVGIATANPEFTLDVAGTINAREFRVNGVLIDDFLDSGLPWRNGASESDIYFNDGGGPGNVGIGTTTPAAKLDVNGGVRVGVASNPSLPGTIQFQNNDFLGYVDGKGYVSLSGIEGNGSANRVTIWSGDQSVTSSEHFIYDVSNFRLGIGTPTPDAHLSIKGQSDDHLFVVRDASDEVLFQISSQNVGIGTSSANSLLTVDGVVDADSFLINGQPIFQAINPTSFWRVTNFGRMIYDKGNVGIGTATPQNLLELASAASSNPIMTFSTYQNNVPVQLYSMGIDYRTPETFVISQGGNLEQPVFAFNRERIGIGLTNPSTNLQVSGNSGVLFVGDPEGGGSMDVTGAGTRFMFFGSKGAIRAGHVTAGQWDDDNVASYSVGFGFNTSANGIASFVGGGLGNEAGGEGSVVPGGILNRALGNYSIAAGHESVANHSGSFVWSDYTPTSAVSYFLTSARNQFIVRANNGMGLNTNDTIGSALTIHKETENGYLLRAKGNTDGEHAFVVTTSGNAGIGTSDPGNARLAVMNGRVGIGTTQPTATLTVSHNLQAGFPFVAYKTDGTPAMFIRYDGKIGIGHPLDYSFTPSENLAIAGVLRTVDVYIQDDSSPEGYIRLEPNPASPWSVPNTANQTFYNRGNVGIGTINPRNLLELSNVSGNRDPIITYDIDGTDVFSMGVSQNFFTIQASGNLDAATPTFTLSQSGLGLGLGYVPASADLHVSGNVIISGNLAIGTTNVTSLYPLLIDATMNVQEFYIQGVQFVPQPTRWLDNTNTLDIFFPGNVGIGTQSPQAKLDVAGTVSANTLNTSAQFSLQGNIAAQQLELRDLTVTTFNKYYYVNVSTGNLGFVDPSTNIRQELSSPLQATDSLQVRGPLSYWVDQTTLGETDIIWDQSLRELSLTGNFIVNTSRKIPNGVGVTSSISMTGVSALDLASTLNHDGDLRNITEYTAQKINVDIASNWGHRDILREIRGLDIKMTQSDPSAVLLNQARAIGLEVDVRNIGVDSASNAYKAAAVFLGGNVGIGVENPSSALEVSGVVSANFFNLSGGLNVPQLVVGTDALYAFKDTNTNTSRVGIGTTVPQTELDVVGTISANAAVLSGGLEATTLNIGSGAFYVNADGNIGIGTTQPNGQIQIEKTLSTPGLANFTGERLELVIDGTNNNNQTFFLDSNLVGMNINLSTEAGNLISQTATGIDLDLTDLDLSSLSTAIGLDIDVSGTGGSRYAALFNGGNVGIGVTQPLAELHVSGDIIADNLFLEGSLIADAATFNNLVIRDGRFLGDVTLNSLAITGTLTANTIVLTTPLVANEATFSTLNAQVASINQIANVRDLNISNTATINSARFESLGIGIAPPASGLQVSGNFISDRVTVTELLNLTTATMNINNNSLFVHRDGNVGIGTSQPNSPLHVQFTGANNFDPRRNNTWNAIRLQSTSQLAGSGTGIILAPDANVPSAAVGSGIVAVRASSGTEGNSHLIFVTDPSTGEPAERLRITDLGNVGIGTTDPQATLDIDGNVLVQGVATINSLQTSQIQSQGDLTINSNSGDISITGQVSANSALLANAGLRLTASSPTPSTLAGYGTLFVSNQDNHLYYMRPSGTSINISAPYAGRPNSIPFFNANGQLDDSAQLIWDNTSNTMVIGSSTSENFSSLELNARLDNNITSNIAAQEISMTFGTRTVGVTNIGDNIFTGLDVNFESLNPSDPINFGRLANNEVAVGIEVDMTTLQAKQTTAVPNSPTLQGFKYAAAFLGGSVGIGTTRPNAQLHIEQEVTTNPILRVDTRDTSNTIHNYALVVSQNGRVGINTPIPSAQLHVVNNDASQPIFTMQDTANQTVFIITNSGNMGIGTDNPTSKVEVAGTVSANQGQFVGLESTTLNIGNGSLVVNSSGNVGINNATPGARFHINDPLTNTIPLGSTHITELTDILITGGTVENPFRFNQDVIGQSTIISSDGSNSIGGPNTATGMLIDLSGLLAAPNTNVVGLDVNVTGTDGERFAAIFRGGNVGIGVDTPTAALHVIGDIQALGLTLSGGLTAGNITGNSLILSGDATANSVLTTDLIATTISANNLIINGTTTIATANVSTMSAQIASINRLGVNVSNPLEALHVSGNGLIEGNLIVSTLNATTVNASSTALRLNATTVNFTGTMNVTGNVVLQNGAILFPTQDLQTAHATRGKLYSREDGHLIYHRPAGSSVNLTAALSGTANTFAYYNNSGQLDSTSLVSWDRTTNVMSIGNNTNTSRLELVTTINASATGNLAAEHIRLAYENRTALNGSITKGLDITMTSLPGQQAILGGDDIAIGLFVDMTNIGAVQSSIDPSDSQLVISGRKAAAAFVGGSVGIGSSDPRAALDVLSTEPDKPIFSAGTTDGTTTVRGLFHITNTGLTGIGTTAPDALLDIVPASSFSGDYLLSVSSITGNREFVVNTAGNIGIGHAFPSANLHLKGDDSFKVDSSTDEGVFGIYNGNIGVGTTDPRAHFSVSGNADLLLRVGNNTNPNTLVVRNNNRVGIGTSAPESALNVNGNVLLGAFTGAGTVPDFFNADSTHGLMIHSGSSTVNATAFLGVRERPSPSDDQEATLFWRNIGNSATNSGLVFIQETSTGNETEVMRLTDTGLLGIGVTDPSAVLHVSQNVIIETNSRANAFFVGANGNVGIHTDLPSSNLHVAGELMADALTLTNDEVNISTLNVSKQLNVRLVATRNQSQNALDSIVQLGIDHTNNLTGLNVRFLSGTNIIENRQYSLNGARAIGLNVDMSALNILDDSVDARKFAATFRGGNVGIGLTEATAPLEVRGPFLGNIARFGTSASELTFKDYDTGTIAFEIRTLLSGVSDGTTHQPMVLSNGNVGIGVTNPSQKLNIDGNVRVGLLRTSTTQAGSASSGAKLLFSGTAADVDNNREIFFQRFNPDSNLSQLQLSLGDGTASDNFVVGYDDSGTFKPILQVYPGSSTLQNRVGINGPGSDDFVPSAALHVLSNTTGTASDPANHAMVIENNSGANADSLVIWHTNYSSVTDPVPTFSNFISFVDSTTVLGEIEGNGADGVRFKTNGADYAEYLPKRSKDEVIEKGDIVSVINGKISKNTDGFQQLMVRSSAASVLGNWPGRDKEADYEEIAFFGQVKVKVVGSIKEGDYILPSGKHDGTGIAVSPEDLTPADFVRIVGRSWESSEVASVKLIHAAVGFNFNLPSLKQELGNVAELQKQLNALQAKQDQMQADFETTYQEREAQINALLEQLN